LQTEEQKLTMCTRPTQFTDGHKGIYIGKTWLSARRISRKRLPKAEKRKDSEKQKLT
jgi:hypothetical protein